MSGILERLFSFEQSCAKSDANRLEEFRRARRARQVLSRHKRLRLKRRAADLARLSSLRIYSTDTGTPD